MSAASGCWWCVCVFAARCSAPGESCSSGASLCSCSALRCRTTAGPSMPSATECKFFFIFFLPLHVFSPFLSTLFPLKQHPSVLVTQNPKYGFNFHGIFIFSVFAHFFASKTQSRIRKMKKKVDHTSGYYLAYLNRYFHVSLHLCFSNLIRIRESWIKFQIVFFFPNIFTFLCICVPQTQCKNRGLNVQIVLISTDICTFCCICVCHIKSKSRKCNIHIRPDSLYINRYFHISFASVCLTQNEKV